MAGDDQRPSASQPGPETAYQPTADPATGFGVGGTPYVAYPTGHGYPTAGPGGVPPDPPRRGGWVWILLGAGAIGVVVVVTAVVVVGLWAGGVFGGHKQIPGASARELVLDESSFPMPYAGGRFSTVEGGGPTSSVSPGHGLGDTFSPAECEQLAQPLQAGAATDQATSMFTHFGGSYDLTYEAAVTKAVVPIFGKFDELLTSCATFTRTSTGYLGDFTHQVNAHKLTVDGVDGDYLGIELSDTGAGADMKTLMLVGQARGVSFVALYTDQSIRSAAPDDLTKIFNAQRARIEQAR